MSTSTNIYAQLYQPDSDDEVEQKKENKQRMRANKGNKNPEEKKKQTGPTFQDNTFTKADTKKDHKQFNTKSKVLSEEPHPLDRKSGTGISGVQKGKLKKGGHGGGNVGTIDDELKGTYNVEGEDNEEGKTQEQEKPQEPQYSTLEDYYASKGIVIQDDDDEEDVKERKVDQAQLKKEKLEIMKTKEDLKKEEADIDVVKPKAKKAGDVGYKASLGTEHSDLLGFNRGFGDRQERGDRGDRKPYAGQKKGGDWEKKGEWKKERKSDNEAEKESDKEKTEVKKEEGADDQQEEKRQPKKWDDDNNNKRGPKRGDNKQDAGKRQYKEKKPKQVNLEDESNFPKLG